MNTRRIEDITELGAGQVIANAMQVACTSMLVTMQKVIEEADQCKTLTELVDRLMAARDRIMESTVKWTQARKEAEGDGVATP